MTRRRPTAAIAALLVALALAGCGLRLETPPPAEPSPDAAEQARALTVDEALDLRDAALAAAAATPGDPAAAVLDDVAAFSLLHADALGGVYDSGLPDPTPGPSVPATPTGAPAPAGPADVLAALRSGADGALVRAGEAADGATARLLAAIGVARNELAARLADALGEVAEPAVSTPTPAPTGLPAGMTQAGATALVLAHDQAGYGLEVVAAKLSDEPRATAVGAAAAHRAAADAWAARAGVAGGTGDPRLVAYALPAGLEDPGTAARLAASLETAVADAVGAALVDVGPGARGELLDLLVASTAAARGWGADAVAFPGLPGDEEPEPTTPPAATTPSEEPARWPPLDGVVTLPTHVPQDTGARPGANGEATTADDGTVTYVVADGDQLGHIALRFFPDDAMGPAINLLTAVNEGLVAESMHAGDALTIPNGRYRATG